MLQATQNSSRPGGADFRNRLLMLLVLALLIAMEIVLNRFASIRTWNLKIGFSFIPIVVAAMLYGPLGGAAVAGIGDLIGAILFPNGPFFPGFTLTAVLTGLVFGFFLHKSQKPLPVAAAVGVNQLILSLLLNTLWISMLYGSPFFPTLVSRLPQCAILIPVQIAVTLALGPALRKAGLPRRA
jgi:ECF transporter S component (folate family)